MLITGSKDILVLIRNKPNLKIQDQVQSVQVLAVIGTKPHPCSRSDQGAPVYTMYR